MSETAPPLTIGILGGSGVYELDGLQDARWEKVASPFGEPSDEILIGQLGGVRYAFLPRHGRGHRIPPSEINYLANIDALKRVGVTDLISIGAYRAGANPQVDVAIAMKPAIEHFLKQSVDETTSLETTREAALQLAAHCQSNLNSQRTSVSQNSSATTK